MDIEILRGSATFYFGDENGVNIDNKTFVFKKKLEKGEFFKLDEKHIVKDKEMKEIWMLAEDNGGKPTTTLTCQ